MSCGKLRNQKLQAFKLWRLDCFWSNFPAQLAIFIYFTVCMWTNQMAARTKARKKGQHEDN